MIRLLLAIAVLAMLPGCGRAAARQGTPPPSKIAESTPRLHFLYSYPAQAAAIPELAALLRKDGLESLAESRRDAAADRRNPRDGPDEIEQVWEVTADTRDLLALTAIASTYINGSAHGYYAHRKVIWSRPERRMIELAELFSDRGRGVELLMADLCARLRSARAKRWRERGGRPMPMECPRADDAAVVPVAGPDGRIRSFRMMLSGDETPDGYAGGSYEIEAPVTPAVAALISPALRGSF
jgi:hypothetical protein